MARLVGPFKPFLDSTASTENIFHYIHSSSSSDLNSCFLLFTGAPASVEILKRDADIIKDSTPVKKQKVKGAPLSSHFDNRLGPAAAAYVGENEVRTWQTMEAKEEIHSMIQSAAQLLTQSLGRAHRFQQEKQNVIKLEAKNSQLTETIVESDKKWKTVLDALNSELDAAKADLKTVKQELKESHEHRDLLGVLNGKLKVENESKQNLIETLEIEKSDWAKERQGAGDLRFQEGFNFYLIGFLAHDPDYDWSKFGRGCVEDIADFKIKNAAAIRDKRIEAGLEAEDPVGAPVVEDAPLNLEQTTPEVQETLLPSVSHDDSAMETVPTSI